MQFYFRVRKVDNAALLQIHLSICLQVPKLIKNRTRFAKVIAKINSVPTNNDTHLMQGYITLGESEEQIKISSFQNSIRVQNRQALAYSYLLGHSLAKVTLLIP